MDLLYLMLPDIEVIKINLNACPVCKSKISYRLQESNIRDHENDPWRPYSCHIFQCIVPVPKDIRMQYPLIDNHFELVIHDDMNATHLSWAVKTNDVEQKLALDYQADLDRQLIIDILKKCEKYSGQELANKIEQKLKTLLTFS